MMNPYYFDYAAATPLDPQVFGAMTPFLHGAFYNPSALYAPSRMVRSAIEEARHEVAKVLGAKPTEIIFTSGGTEANNLAIQGVLRSFEDANTVVSAVEHDSVIAAARLYGDRAIVCPVTPDGTVDITALQSMINDHTVLVSVMYANNEVGTIQPIRDIAKIVHGVRDLRQKSGNMLPLYLHTDACQAANYLDLHVSRLGVDLMTLNGSKIYGPKGSGVLYIRTGVQLQPLIVGGGQESGVRSGTENVSGYIGFARALQLTTSLRESEAQRLTKLRDDFIARITTATPQIQINGSIKNRLANNIHITVPGFDAETLILQLEQKGILCAAGSACSASNQEPSHVLTAMGVQESAARSSLRITLGRQTDNSAMQLLADTLISLVA